MNDEIARTHTTARDVDDPSLPSVVDLVQHDIEVRRQQGLEKYKVPLRPFDGNDFLVEAYQEAIDMVVYLRAALWERDRR